MKLILCGGGWAGKTVIPNKVFESLIDSSKKLLYIPLARKPGDDNYENCRAWLLDEFKNIQHGEIEVVRNAAEINDKNMSDYAGVFIGGGNTYKLLKELKETGAFNKLLDCIKKGVIIYGCSAGSIIFGKNIDSCLYMDANEVTLTDTFGFNAIYGFSFTAHYTNKNEEKTKVATDYLTEYSYREPVLALPEEDSLFINNNVVKIIGSRPYYIFNNGHRVQQEPNIEYTEQEFISLVKNV